jgi:uncharacterized repeat protein (TIGR03803 family)
MSKRERCRGALALACAFAGLGIATALAQTAQEVVLHNFANLPKGANPWGGVIRDSAGNLYGTTKAGGTAGAGVVYKMDPAGHQTVLHNFTGNPDGSFPNGDLVRDSAGNLYGVTYTGGVGAGVVYKLDPAGRETVLWTFTGGADGGNPTAGVIRDSAGNLYGTTAFAATGPGVVFKLDPSGQETVLYTFPGGADGQWPFAGLVRDSAGNLYGTTYQGGVANAGCPYGCGVVFKLDTTGHETVLYSFTGGADGGFPAAGLTLDSAGNLYGTTTYGGASGAGVVFEVNASDQETALYSFTGGADGAEPRAGVIRDAKGNLYGTTSGGGAANQGVVYKLDAAGHETVLHSFTGGADGCGTRAGVIRDSEGNLYGTTEEGGVAGGLGVVFKLDAAGQETALYSFPGAAGGTSPEGVIADSAGNLYGTAGGGAANWGLVYKLGPAGHQTVLYNFTGGADGANPYGGLIRDQAGNLYGTTPAGGSGAGVVYKLDAAGHQTVLYTFTGGADGGKPYAGVIRDAAGNLYGTATSGGTAGAGVVFKLDAMGHEKVLYNFPTGPDAPSPASGVIRDPAGNLYGASDSGGPAGAGLVYKLDTSGNFTALYSFTGGDDGAYPTGVIRDSAGNLYGAAGGDFQGANSPSVVFKLDAEGHETVLYTFTAGRNGVGPSVLIRDSAGNLYGTWDGTAYVGSVYKLDTAGNFTVLYNFTGGADGGYPVGGVIRDSAGNLYGTTLNNGKYNGGVVFKIEPQ